MAVILVSIDIGGGAPAFMFNETLSSTSLGWFHNVAKLAGKVVIVIKSVDGMKACMVLNSASDPCVDYAKKKSGSMWEEKCISSSL